jgi:hypothetical protein
VGGFYLVTLGESSFLIKGRFGKKKAIEETGKREIGDEISRIRILLVQHASEHVQAVQLLQRGGDWRERACSPLTRIE